MFERIQDKIDLAVHKLALAAGKSENDFLREDVVPMFVEANDPEKFPRGVIGKLLLFAKRCGEIWPVVAASPCAMQFFGEFCEQLKTDRDELLAVKMEALLDGYVPDEEIDQYVRGRKEESDWPPAIHSIPLQIVINPVAVPVQKPAS